MKFDNLRIQIDDSQVLNHLIYIENRIEVTQESSDKVYNELDPTGSRPCILYGLCKIHKSIADGFQPFVLYCQLYEPLLLNPRNFLYHY